MSKKLKSLNFIEKSKILKEKENSPNLSQRKLAEIYGVSATTINRSLKRKKEINELIEDNIDAKRKRKNRTTNNEDLNKVMNEWWKVVRIKGIPMTGPAIQKQALRYAQKLDLVDFRASDGWLRCFKNRNGVFFRSINGEAKDVNVDTVENWKLNLPCIYDGYEARNIFNADETGLFFRALPNKTLASKDDKCIGGKLSKDRITVLLCVNALGDKLKPLVIGKSKSPKSFRKMSHNLLPVTWRWSQKSWMTGEIFDKWLTDLNTKMTFENRKILLFIDNAPVHGKLKLSNVSIKFFPPNTTCSLQPLDQGIIKNFKYHYRTFFIEKLLSLIESEQDTESAYRMVKDITILDSLYWIKTAWSQVDSNTIINCFKHAGFNQDYVINASDLHHHLPSPSPSPSIILSRLDIPGLTLEDTINIDENLATCETYLDASLDNLEDKIMNNVLEEIDFNIIQEDDDNEKENDDNEIVKPVCTDKEVKGYLALIRDYCIVKSPDLVESIVQIQNKLIENRVCQSDIRNFFKH